MYFKRLAFICAEILLIAAQGTELSNDVFIISICLVVTKISLVEDEGRSWGVVRTFFFFFFGRLRLPNDNVSCIPGTEWVIESFRVKHFQWLGNQDVSAKKKKKKHRLHSAQFVMPKEKGCNHHPRNRSRCEQVVELFSHWQKSREIRRYRRLHELRQ